MTENYFKKILLNQSKVITKNKNTFILSLLLTSFFGVTLIPLFFNQFISGPIVNAILIIVTIILGLRSGIILSFIPSVIALIGGLLPSIFIFFVPFIIFSNIIMVFIFHNLRLKDYWLAGIISSIVKFIFLTISSQLFFNFFLKTSLSKVLAYTMSWNQLYSALLGCLLAYGFLKIIKRI